MTLVVAIGGVRSGKSAWAENQARELAGDGSVTVLATADPTDRSMADRIARHTARRPGHWPVVELLGLDDLAGTLPAHGAALLDGLGGWVAALLDRAGAFAEDREEARAATRRAGEQAHQAVQGLIDASRGAQRALVVASEETGLGVVPLGAGTAAWVDLVGELNQRLVRAADLAVVVVAGRALPLTDAAQPLTRPTTGPALSVVASDGSPSGPPIGDGERRAHPRLLGAGATVRSIRNEPARPTTGRIPRDDDAPTGSGPRLTHAPDADGSPGAAPVALPGNTATETSVEVDLAALRHHGDRLVRDGDADHAVNVVAQGPPAWLTDALAGALATGLTSYPDVAPAQAALAGIFARPAAEVVVTNGAAEALWLLPAALRPRLAACLHPLFTEAEAALHAHGVPVVRVHRDPELDFAIDPRAVPEEADLVLVGNPAAANGTLAPRDEILALRRPGRTVVVDEAFMDLVVGEGESLAREAIEGVIVVRSFTKSLSIPGVRAGCAITTPELAARLRGVQPPWSVNAFAIAGIRALAANADELASRARRAAGERDDLVAGLSALPGVRVWPSATNHVLMHVAGGSGVAQALRARRIAVRPCGSFPGLSDDHLRITARDAKANAALLATLTEVLAGPEPSA